MTSSLVIGIVPMQKCLCECWLIDDSAALQRRRNRQDALKSYYSLADEPTASSSERATGTAAAESCDINAPSFEPDVYLNRLIKEHSLTELMDKEAEITITNLSVLPTPYARSVLSICLVVLINISHLKKPVIVPVQLAKVIPSSFFIF